VGRSYDHRIKILVAASGDPHLFPNLKIPRSTAKQWIKHGVKPVVTLPGATEGEELALKVAQLEKQFAEVDATHRLVVFTFKIFGLQIQYTRLPSEDAKTMLLAAIQGAAKLVPLVICLEAIGLSAARFRAWCVRQRDCRLADQRGCPKLAPARLTTDETSKIRDLVTNPRFAHFSITALATYAKRQALVFASPTSWSRLIRRLGLKRPRYRVHPLKPRVGIRASAPLEIWHLDVTVIRLLDGTRVFVQAVIDNFSRYILACRTTTTYGGASTKALLFEAMAKAKELGCTLLPTVLVDSGTENINADVDELIATGALQRVIAQIEVEFSNSMVEALFRRMKHGYLFLQRLSSAAVVAEHVNFYVREHNDVIPHSALAGATPLEVVTRRWTSEARDALIVQQRVAIENRMASNRSIWCTTCPTLVGN